MRNTPTYKVWTKMRERCNGHGNRFYRYGGRGISYDPSWDDFLVFLEDMGERPEGMTIERIDNDGNYCKENCRWASYMEQSRNMSRNVWYEIDGTEYIQEDAYRVLGVSIKILRTMRAKNNLPDNVKFLGRKQP
jgi:hypothetical protein